VRHDHEVTEIWPATRGGRWRPPSVDSRCGSRGALRPPGGSTRLRQDGIRAACPPKGSEAHRYSSALRPRLGQARGSGASRSDVDARSRGVVVRCLSFTGGNSSTRSSRSHPEIEVAVPSASLRLERGSSPPAVVSSRAPARCRPRRSLPRNANANTGARARPSRHACT